MTAAALATQFAAHQTDSIRAVYRIYGGLVYSVCYQVLGEVDLAETATQQTFMQAWTNADTLTAESALGPWLRTIAHRVASDLGLRQRQGGRDHIDSDQAAPVDDCRSADLLADSWKLRAALDRLPDEDRELIELHHHRQLSYTEIAGHWHLPVASVKSRSHRAHRRLARLLGNLRAGSVDAEAAET